VNLIKKVTSKVLLTKEKVNKCPILREPEGSKELSSVKQENQKLIGLRRRLEELRYDFASQLDCPANSIYSNTVINDLLHLRPTMISTLNRIESLSEFRRKQQFSPKIFDIISEYCLLNAIPSDCVAQDI